MKTNPIESIKDRFLASQQIAITSHLRPDGDSICTSLALLFMGRQLGKEMAMPIKRLSFSNARMCRVQDRKTCPIASR